MSSLYRIPLFALSFLVALPLLALEARWEFKPPLGQADASPAIADLNCDGVNDVVVTTSAGSIIAIDHLGRQIWMRGVQIPISIAPTAVNLLEDETPEVLAVNQSGQLFCMAGRNGDPIWDYSLPGKIAWGMTALSVHDLDGDGALEIIAADDAGHVVCLSRDGELRWQYDGDHGHGMCPAVGLIGDGKHPVIVMAGPKTAMLCLDAKGKLLWKVEGVNGASPVIADLDGDGKNEIVGAMDNALMAVDAKGKVLWKLATPRTIDSSIAVADADEDGVNEIYAVDLGGQVICASPDGKQLWTADIRERSRRSPTVGDVDGDGKLEVIVAGYSGELFLYTGKGDLKESHPMPQSTNASPTIADLKGDGTPSVVYVTATGSVIAYGWPEAKPDAKVQWPEYRFSSQRGGEYLPPRAQSPVKIAHIDFGDLYAGTNAVSLQVENPEQAELHVIVQVDRTGEKTKHTDVVSRDAVVSVQADYLIGAGAPAQVTIRASVVQGEVTVAHRSLSAYVVPFLKEVDDLTRLIQTVQTNAGQLPKAFALLGEAAAAQGRFADYSARAAVAGTLSEVGQRELRDSLREDLNRFAQLKTLTDNALASRAEGAWPIQVAAANPWAPFGGTDEVLESRTAERQVTIEAFQGETENAALNAFNWSADAQTLRVELDDIVREGADAATGLPWHEVVTLHEVVAVPAQTLDKSADALPVMNQGQVLTLPGWDSRQVWLTVNTSKLEPGTWKSVVHLRTLEVETQSFDLPLTIQVSAVKLADTGVLRHCNWGYVASSRLKHHEPQAIADRVAHGNNVFVSTFLPRATYDAEGNLTGEIDYTAHDEYMAKYAPNGLILFQNYNPITTTAPLDSEAYKKAYVHYVREWVKHLATLGVGYDGFAMYPIDEPGLTDGLVQMYLHNAKLTREADPKILMYTDPVARITEEELREMAPWVDIWCPNRVGFLLNVGSEKLKIMQEDPGAILWNYECQGNAKHQSPLGYYRAQAWLAWHHNLTGIGFWSYCTSSADPWYRPVDTLDYLMIYQGDGPVSSKRWEAVRDGVEDYAMLHALREATEAAKARGGAPEAVKEAEALLDGGATAIAQFCGLDEHGTEPGKGGAAGGRKLADERFQAIQETRRKIARLMPLLAP